MRIITLHIKGKILSDTETIEVYISKRNDELEENQHRLIITSPSRAESRLIMLSMS